MTTLAMTTLSHQTYATQDVHPLHRLAMEAPEQLDPCLRRAAFRMARRRFAGWLREVFADVGAAVSRLPTA